MQVVGETKASHPLEPGSPDFSNVTVSVIKDTTIANGESSGMETYYDPTLDPEAWSTTFSVTHQDETWASYYGIAADEYVVKMSSLGDLWTDIEEGEASLELLTRKNPAGGDLWASLNGNYLYFYEGKEKIPVGDQTLNTNRIEVYAVGDVDATAQSVLEQCLVVTPATTTSTSGTDSNVDSVYLDPGCDAAFVHYRVGTEWWFDEVLVKEETTTYSVTIDSYGWESYDAGAADCVRMVDTSNPHTDAELFVEYTVTTTTNTWAADSLEVLKDDLVSPAD